GPGVLVAVHDDVGLPALPWHGDRDQLVGEPAVLLRGHRALLGAGRQLVLLLAGDVVLPAEVLGGLDHAAGNRVEPAAGGLAGPVEPVHQLDAARPDTGPEAERVVLDLRHRLGTPGHHQRGGAGGDLARGVQARLQARAAAPVDLEARHPGAETRVQRGDPADRGGLAVRVAL